MHMGGLSDFQGEGGGMEHSEALLHAMPQRVASTQSTYACAR